MSNICPACMTENPDNALSCGFCGCELASPGGGSSSSPLHLPAGTQLQQGKYQIEKTLGEGGFGITYKGIDRTRSQPVAIKELWPENAYRKGTQVLWPSSTPPQVRNQQIKKFQLEAQYLSRCQHPNIVRVYGWFAQNDTAYIVMELLSGRSLLDILQSEGPLPEERVKRYLIKIAESLKVIHANNLLHRDIKPENILVDDRDRAVLIDFGAAREFVAGQTGDMSRIVTEGYAPYEQYAQKSKRFPATDFYALCASIYELLTGELPVNAPERVNTLLQPEASDPLIPPRKLRPELTPFIEKVLLTGLRINVRERFQTADELINALKGKFVSPSQKRGQESIRRGEFVEAVRAYEQCLASEPDNGEAAVELAMVLVHLSAPQTEAAAKRAIQLQPKDGRGYGILGLLHCRCSQWPAAVGQLQQAAGLSPNEAWIQANLAWALGKSGDWQQADRAIDKALQLEPESLFAGGVKAWISANQQRWKETIRHARPVLFKARQIKAQQKNDRGYEELASWIYPCLIIALEKAVISRQSREVDRGLYEFTQQVPNSALAWGLAGWKQAQAGQWSGAISCFDRAVNQPQAPTWVWINLAIAREYSQDISGAIQAYQDCENQLQEHQIQEHQLQEHQPSPDAFLFFRLGTLLGKQQQWQPGKTYLERAIQVNTNYAEAYHNLGWVLLNSQSQNGTLKGLKALLSAYRQAVQLYRDRGEENMSRQIERAFQEAGVEL